MKIFIITMDDPVYTIPFIHEIIKNRSKDIIGVAVSEGDRMRIGKKRSKLVYLMTLLLIMGVTHFVKYASITVIFKIKKKLSKSLKGIKSPTILTIAKDYDIPTYDIKTPNGKSFLRELAELKPDVIINQAQSIIKKDLLAIPTIGVLNRHNALLPRNRGRLTPFWVLHKNDKQTGVSIHFVDEGIDSGDIVVQERFDVQPTDNFNSIVRKNYKVAPKAMLKALDILEEGNFKTIKNEGKNASYNSVPEFKDALHFRINRIKRLFA